VKYELGGRHFFFTQCHLVPFCCVRAFFLKKKKPKAGPMLVIAQSQVMMFIYLYNIGSRFKRFLHSPTGFFLLTPGAILGPSLPAPGGSAFWPKIRKLCLGTKTPSPRLAFVPVPQLSTFFWVSEFCNLKDFINGQKNKTVPSAQHFFLALRKLHRVWLPWNLSAI
jgi:hypothetical protein